MIYEPLEKLTELPKTQHEIDVLMTSVEESMDYEDLSDLRELTVDEWLKHEETPDWLVMYAKNILGERWKVCEEIIKSDKQEVENYESYFNVKL